MAEKAISLGRRPIPLGSQARADSGASTTTGARQCGLPSDGHASYAANTAFLPSTTIADIA